MKIAIIGHSRCGKDTVAELISEATGLRYVGSISWFCKERVADELGISSQKAWETRHAQKGEWRRIIDEFRRHDPGCILHDLFAVADIVAGIRPKVEFNAVFEHFTHVIWIDRDVPPDPTLELTDRDATSIIKNHGSLEDLEATVKEWLSIHKICQKLEKPRRL